MELLFFFIASNFMTPCEEAENKPMGDPRQCSLSVEGACCTWHSIEDRYCIPGPSDDCAPFERAMDSFNALRTSNRWCYRFWCGWLLEKESYYSFREGRDKHSKALQQIHQLVRKYKFKRAKKLARRELVRLVKIDWCEKDEPCDDYLEFVINATNAELRQAAREWREEITP
jgi:hypothetical protein